MFDIYGTLLVSGAGEIDVHAADTSPVHRRHAAFEGALSDAGYLVRSGRTGPRLASLFREEIERLHAAGRARAGEAPAQPEVDIRTVWKTVLGRAAMEGLVDATGGAGDVEELALRFELAINPAGAMPGAGRVLGALAHAELPVSVVSNAQFYTMPVLRRLLPEAATLGDTGPVVLSYLYGFAKPDSRIFATLLARSQALLGPEDPASLLYVGNDMLNDVWAASRAGLRTCLFAGDAASLRLRTGDDRTTGVKPDTCVVSLDELLSVLAVPFAG